MDVIKHEVNTGVEELILVGMIISKEFLSEVDHILEIKYFQSPQIKLVAEWVLDYWEEFREVPKKAIQEIYVTECEQNRVNRADQNLIRELLSNLFARYEGRDFNHAYMIQKALDYIRERSLRLTIEESLWLLDRKGAEEAEDRITEHKKVIKKTSSNRYNSWLGDFEKNFDAWFYQDRNPIMTFSGALGKYMDPLLRGKLIAFLAPPKSGKSYHLIHTAFTALTQRRNVLFFSLEMSNEEVQERFTSMALAKERTRNSSPVEYNIPVYDCMLNQNGECNKHQCPNPGESILIKGELPKYTEAPDHVPCTACRGEPNSDYAPATWMETETRDPLKYAETFRSIKALKKHFYLDGLRIFTFGIGKATITNIEDVLDYLESDKAWLPDVICLDYADLLNHNTTYKERRHQLGHIWENLSRIAKGRKVLLFTASQGNRASANKAQLESSDIAEDWSKVAIVDGLIGIDSNNSSAFSVEKDSYWGRHSLHWLASRYHRHLKSWQSCQVLHQFAIGQPVVDSEIIDY